MPLARRCGPAASRAVVVLLLAHVVLLAYSAANDGPTWDEVAHLPAGVSHWRFGWFDLFRVNPPLVRMVAAIPVVAAAPEFPCAPIRFSAEARPEFAIGDAFLTANGSRSIWYFTLARWACIPFSVLGGYVCWCWARELHGNVAGVVAVTLWCFCPNILGNGHLIMPDTAASALGATASYAFWKWLRQPSWRGAFVTGLVLGLTQLTKTTWIVLFGLWPLIWWMYRISFAQRLSPGSVVRFTLPSIVPANNARSPCLSCPESLAKRAWRWESLQLGLMLVLAVYVINVGYGFEGSFQKLGEYRFVSEALGGPRNRDIASYDGRNRFAATWMSMVPLPLPRNYVLGIDVTKSEFEQKKWSYLRGEWRFGGWWYYYLYALAIKVPLGTWTLICLAFFSGVFCRGYSVPWRDDLALMAPLLAVLLLVSSQTGFNHHLRYVLPIFPFAFVLTSRIGRAISFGDGKLALTAFLALVWSVGSSLCVYPHSLSYFNELAGGPRNGHYHLESSNTEWGQDLLYLKRWLDRHPEATPVGLAWAVTVVDPRIVGIESTLPPRQAPSPGWYAVSVNLLHTQDERYSYFLRLSPVATVGYSIFIYHITSDDANEVRREMGLPALYPTANPSDAPD